MDGTRHNVVFDLDEMLDCVPIFRYSEASIKVHSVSLTAANESDIDDDKSSFITLTTGGFRSFNTTSKKFR